MIQKNLIKRIILFLMLGFTLFSLTSPVKAAPAIPPCSVYEIYSYQGAGYHTGINSGNFTAVTLFADPKGVTGGQTNWVRLHAREIDFIKLVNKDSFKPWGWADGISGTIYLGSGNDYEDTVVKWPRIALASSDETIQPRNQVCVTGRSADGRYARIVGIPKSADYTQYLQYSFLFQTAYTVYPDMHTGYLALYKMPLWEPSSGFEVSRGDTGLWIPTIFLAAKLGEFNGAIVPVPTPSPTPTPSIGSVTVVPGQVVYQYPNGPKVFVSGVKKEYTILQETRYWIQIGFQRWIYRLGLRAPL